MGQVIRFPEPDKGRRTEERRVDVVDNVAHMPSEQIVQADILVGPTVQHNWIDADAESGEVFVIGANVFRRTIPGARILEADDVGIVNVDWIRVVHQYHTELMKRWGGPQTVVWHLVRSEGRTGSPDLLDEWHRLSGDESPVERFIVVEHSDELAALPTPDWTMLREPVVVIHPDQLDEVLAKIAAEHRGE